MSETIFEYLRKTAEAAGFGEARNPILIIGSLINTFLSLTGIIFLYLILYGGFLWMTSGGNEEKVNKAKRVLTQAVIGLVIIFSSYAIAVFVIDSLTKATVQ